MLIIALLGEVPSADCRRRMIVGARFQRRRRRRLVGRLRSGSHAGVLQGAGIRHQRAQKRNASQSLIPILTSFKNETRQRNRDLFVWVHRSFWWENSNDLK